MRLFLANQAFDPETIRDMTLALERVCATLDLPVQDEPATRLVVSQERHTQGLRRLLNSRNGDCAATR